MPSGCGLFDESATFTDPCAEADGFCTPGAKGFRCRGKGGTVIRRSKLAFLAGLGTVGLFTGALNYTEGCVSSLHTTFFSVPCGIGFVLE